MTMKEESNILNEEELEQAAGGNAPELPAAELSESGYANVEPAVNRNARPSTP